MWEPNDPAGRREKLPPLSEVIEAARRQRAGPPRDPQAAAYPHAVRLARDMLWREIKNERRREAVLEEFANRIARIERSLESCDTLGDQLLALDRVIADADFHGLDLRKCRDSKGPDDETLLDTYDSVYRRVRRIFGRRADRDPARLVERLANEFPSLTPEQVAEATFDKPSWGAYTVLGALLDLSPSRARDRLVAARKRVRKGR